MRLPIDADATVVDETLGMAQGVPASYAGGP